MTSVYCFVSHILAGGTTEQFTWNTLSSVPQLLMDGSNAYIYGPQGTALGTAPVEQISLSAPNSQSSVTYLVSDPEGVRLTFNSTGTITADASYDAYGQVIAGGLSSITPFGYAGGYTDPTGLIYLINRYYDPSTGQFLSVDPLVGITDQPYQYAGGDPVNFTDPLGLACWAALEFGFTQASRNCWKSGYKRAGHDVAHGTVGVCISGVAGAGVGGTGQVCFVESQGFKHAGFTETLGGGDVSLTGGFSLGLQFSNAKSPNDLGGLFGYANGSVVIGPDGGWTVGGSGFIGMNPCNRTIAGANVDVGVSVKLPVPWSAGAGVSNTWVQNLW